MTAFPMLHWSRPATEREDWRRRARRGTVSVIIPTYNRASFLAAALESVWEQTMVVDEVIVVDDGSTDATAEYLESIKDIRPALQVVRQSNAGVAAARNHGLAVSSGEYIAFLDSDDRWMPAKVEHCLQIFQDHPDAGTVYHSAHVVDAATGAFLAYSGRNLAIDFAAALARDFPGPQSVMVRRDLIAQVGGFDQQLATSDDWEIFIRFAEARLTRGSAEALVAVSRGEGHRSLTTTWSKPWKTQREILKRYKLRARSQPELRRAIRRARRSIRDGVYWRHSRTIKAAYRQQAWWGLLRATAELTVWNPAAVFRLPQAVLERAVGRRRSR